MKHYVGALAAVFFVTGCGGPPATNDASEGAVAPSAEQPDLPQKATAKNAYFGDLHVHTTNSFDAYIFNVRTTPDAAYRFAKGESIKHDAGYDIQLAGPPLDFLAVTDHGEYLGIVPAMDNPERAVSRTPTAQSIFGDNRSDARTAFQRVGLSFVIGEPIEEIYDRDLIDSVWAETVEAAERHNDPGVFTAFSGYEFTAMRLVNAGNAANLHRNVIFRGEAPRRIFTTLDSTNPEDLWDWMDAERMAGRDALAIPHNSNASNGEMFAMQTYEGARLTSDYAAARMRNEPLVEITQIKGTSETHPSLSPNDEWAGFEQYEYFIGGNEKLTPGAGDYVRSALGNGLVLQDGKGFNPYKFGVIGSSDTHVGAATLREETHWGKFPQDGAGPQARQSVPPNGAKVWDTDQAETNGILASSQYSASGLAGVWAEANTRASLFDAMRRKETFGTSGPRIRVRMFAGYGFDEAILSAPDLIEQAYAGGVPIGGELAGSGEAPAFIAWAMRDPISAPLQRLQIVKVWSENGAAREAVYDAACAGGADVDAATHRCPDNGSSVDISDCSTQEGSGANELKTLWRDPEFDISQRAAYYVRVLENPTCRWSTWDAVRNGTPPNPALPVLLQERAWTSPIWYRPL